MKAKRQPVRSSASLFVFATTLVWFVAGNAPSIHACLLNSLSHLVQTSYFLLAMSLRLARNTLQVALNATRCRVARGNRTRSIVTPESFSRYQRHDVVSLQSNRSFSQEMKDEYGEMTAEGDSFVKQDFVLENKDILPVAELRYQTYGQLNEARDNALVICHALTGNASLHSWWGGLLGESKAFDTSKYFVICCNILGSCYGSTNPQSIDERTGAAYGVNFPDISVQDTARLQLLLLKEELKLSSIKSVIGGSFGGMQTMEFAVQGGSSVGEFRANDGRFR